MAEIIQKPDSRGLTWRDTARRVFRHENAVLALVLLGIFAALAGATKGLNATPRNGLIILLTSATNGIAAIGQTFVILTAGIDLSVGGVASVTSIIGASSMTSFLYTNIVGHAVPMQVMVPLMVLIGAGFGAINGLAVSRIGLPPIIATLAMWRIGIGLAFQVASGNSVFGLPIEFTFFGQGRIAGVPVAGIIFVAVCVVAYFLLNHTTFGRSIYSVGGNPVTAWLTGVNVKNIKLLAYIISGLLAGLASVVFTSRVMNGSPGALQGLELSSIAASCIGGISLAGGKGNVLGVVIGVLIFGVVDNAMSILGATPGIKGIVTGVIIITAVAVDYVRRRGG
jgi:ribose/xylose/arabinose/galactoside ABC-type transport system permease subunit